MKDTPTTSRTNTPTKHTSSLPVVIPSISETQPPIDPPLGHTTFPEDPLKCQAAIREQITADAKTLSTASCVLCTNFHHMSDYDAKWWRAMRECQLQGVGNLKKSVKNTLIE